MTALIINGKTDRDRIAEGEAILRDRVHGMSQSALMEKYGVPRTTLHRRINDALSARLALTVDQYREEQTALLDDLAERWRQRARTEPTP